MGDGEEAKTLDDRRGPLPPVRSVGAAPRRRGRRARRRRRRRHRRVRGRHVPPRHRRAAGADDAARDGRRRDRRQDRREPARGQEPRRRVPPARSAWSPTPTRSPRCPSGSTGPGLGEVAKYALLGEAVLGTDPCRRAAAPGPRRRCSTATRRCSADLVARCAAIKADVVAADPEERTGLRATLNLGHTLAHALETAGGYGLTHGEAVAIGLVFAGALAGRCERVPADVVDRYREAVRALGLPDEVLERCPRAASSSSWRATRRRAAGSRSCSRAPTGSTGSTIRPHRRSSARSPPSVSGAGRNEASDRGRGIPGRSEPGPERPGAKRQEQEGMRRATAVGVSPAAASRGPSSPARSARSGKE